MQCPYHAWTYGLDGGLRHAPRSDLEPDFDRAELRLAARADRACGGRRCGSTSTSTAPSFDAAGSTACPALTAEHGVDMDAPPLRVRVRRGRSRPTGRSSSTTPSSATTARPATRRSAGCWRWTRSCSTCRSAAASGAPTRSRSARCRSANRRAERSARRRAARCTTSTGSSRRPTSSTPAGVSTSARVDVRRRRRDPLPQPHVRPHRARPTPSVEALARALLRQPDGRRGRRHLRARATRPRHRGRRARSAAARPASGCSATSSGSWSRWSRAWRDASRRHTPAEDRYETMTYRRCGRSGLQLPSISLGAWETFGGYRDADVARECFLRAFDLGVTHFDFADNYGQPPGNAELVCGPILRRAPARRAGHLDQGRLPDVAGPVRRLGVAQAPRRQPATSRCAASGSTTSTSSTATARTRRPPSRRRSARSPRSWPRARRSTSGCRTTAPSVCAAPSRRRARSGCRSPSSSPTTTCSAAAPRPSCCPARRRQRHRRGRLLPDGLRAC